MAWWFRRPENGSGSEASHLLLSLLELKPLVKAEAGGE
jgi:hypothetical protein